MIFVFVFDDWGMLCCDYSIYICNGWKSGFNPPPSFFFFETLPIFQKCDSFFLFVFVLPWQDL